MEMKDLVYFTAVAKTQNIHKAAKEISISPGSLSKAITRLENELKIKLFDRIGRNIKLTTEGKFLRVKANEILNLEEKTRIDILGQIASFRAVIGAPEILLAYYGVEIAKKIKEKYPNAQIELLEIDESKIESKVKTGEIHLAITSKNITKNFDFKKIADIHFLTVVGKEHPLAKSGKKNVDVYKLLDHDFVTPKTSILGSTENIQSLDGWRDDKFPRKRIFLTSSLKTIGNLVSQGSAVAYLPDYMVNNNYKVLNVTGCPYTCNQKIRLVTKDKKMFGWLNNIF